VKAEAGYAASIVFAVTLLPVVLSNGDAAPPPTCSALGEQMSVILERSARWNPVATTQQRRERRARPVQTSSSMAPGLATAATGTLPRRRKYAK